MTAPKAGFLQAARAVFWAFFGVRRHEHYQSDAQNLTPLQVIAAGLIGTVLLIAAVAGIVYLVLD